ncbi:gfo/Idh/MocA family oxidoreductase [Pseudomonas sp. PB120]|uniref:Gfo/Idh/MocA family protein n=1 Tax=Pseudomonas sp. PB120 TaxID=2494700 RepID=UPI0012FD34E7|nr:Gfo/Idh/MocA family oxidoreductase [Pseudomonas sp. PB120]MVV49346.1 gfo/Idh/MocA family oxidoreductase [Pseudomonas sp. PB120]
MTTQTSPIRVGIVGVGNWARHGHLRVLDLLPQYTLQAVYSEGRERAEAAAGEYGILQVADSVDALVNNPDVDLVVVLNTAPQHEQTVRAAIAAGKNVYCEWPLTTTTAASEQLLQLANDAGVRHIVGLQRRHAPHNRYLQDLLQQGYVGKLRSVRLHVSMNYFQALRPNALRWTAPEENFSSVIAIYAGHFLDMLFTATGWPRSVSGLLVNQFPKVTIKETGEVLDSSAPDQLVLSGLLDDGAVVSVHIEGGKRNGSGVQIDITGDEGDLKITNRSAFGDVGDDYVIEGAHGDNLALEVLPLPEQYLRLPASTLPSAVLELAELYHVYAQDVAEGTRAAATFDDALRLHRLLDAAKKGVQSPLA